MILRVLIASAALGLAACVHMAPPPDNFVPVWPHGIMVQGMLGISEMSKDPLEAFGSPGSGGDVGSTTLPIMAAAVQHPLAGEHLQRGIEWGGTLGWDRDVTYVPGGLGGGQIRAENDLWTGDFFVGGFLSLWFDGGSRLYTGAGPLLHYGFVELEFDDENGDHVQRQDSGYGAGIYARGGFEMPLWANTWIGLQVRWLEVDLDFSGDIGTLDVESVQFMLTVTQGF